MPDNLQNVCLVRHGETEWAMTGRHTGRTDIPLTARGEEEARELRRFLQNVTFAEVMTSPLRRARQTCELSGACANARSEPDLVEWDYGAYEGRQTSEIRAERPNWSLFTDGCPGGETAEAVGARVERVLARVRGCNGDVLLFAHRDVLRVLTARWLDLPAWEGRRFYLTTASISVLGFHHGLGEPVVRLWNMVAGSWLGVLGR
jgi:probable phosphoglycerate mutase